MLGWRSCSPPLGQLPFLRALLGTGLVVLVVIWVGSSNRILFDQRRINLWDMQKANQLCGS